VHPSTGSSARGGLASGPVPAAGMSRIADLQLFMVAYLEFVLLQTAEQRTFLMVRTFLKVYMEIGSSFLFLLEQIKDIIIM
jgi:poly(3-hydroxybutyrate) depolymerase